MKTSTMIFNAAGVLTLLAVLCAVVNLAQNKTKSVGITPPPSSAPIIVSMAPIIASSPPTATLPVVTSAPAVVTTGPYFGYPLAMNTMGLGAGAISQAYPGVNPYAGAMNPNPYAVNPLLAYSGTPGVPTVNATNTLGTTMGATPGAGPVGM